MDEKIDVSDDVETGYRKATMQQLTEISSFADTTKLLFNYDVFDRDTVLEKCKKLEKMARRAREFVDALDVDNNATAKLEGYRYDHSKWCYISLDGKTCVSVEQMLQKTINRNLAKVNHGVRESD